MSLLNSYLDIKFDVLHAAINSRHADGRNIRLVNLALIALFSNYKLTTSNGKYLEDINQAHFVYLMYKLITSSRDTDDLSIGVDRDLARRQRELTINKKQKGKCYVTIMLRDIFGSAEHQQKATYGLGYR